MSWWNRKRKHTSPKSPSQKSRLTLETLEERAVPSTAGSGRFEFEPLAASAAATNGGDEVRHFVLPPGFNQTIVAREGDGGTNDLWDMNTQNETGPQAGRFIYRTHEVGTNGMVSETDLWTGQTRILAQDPGFRR